MGDARLGGACLWELHARERCTPARDARLGDAHPRKVHAWEMHAWEMHTHERCTPMGGGRCTPMGDASVPPISSRIERLSG
jgi:hypothetical protein